MTKTNTKRLVLGILFLVLIYVWGGNVGLFTSGNPAISIETRPTASNDQTNPPGASLEYMPPKINPFARPTEGTKQAALPSALRRADTTPKPSISNRLTGILRRGKSSQAVILSPTGESMILSLRDSLGGWIVSGIEEQLIVLQKSKHHDTLFLQETQR